MGLSLRGVTSGAVDINAPAVAGDNTITLPGNSGSANQFYKNSGTAGIITHSSMVEDSSGNIGIGTDNPQRKLVVSDNGTEGLEFYPGDSINGSTINVYNRATSAFTPFSLNAQEHRFTLSGGLEGLRINSNGDLGINTTGGNYTVQMHEPTLGSFTLQMTNGAIGSANTSGTRITASSSRKLFIENQENEDTLFYNNGGEKLVIKAGGDVSITDGNLVVASGHGIDFSATSDGSGTTTSEVLDDYEEGTFTPTFSGQTTAGTYTYGTQTGYYVKVGKVVYFRVVLVDINTSSAGTGNMLVGGLPFTSQTNSSFECAPPRTDGFTFTADWVTPVVNNGNTNISFYVVRSGQSDVALSVTSKDNNTSDMFIAGFYFIP